MAWSWARLRGEKDKTDPKGQREASPPANVYPFVVPSYRRGGPYSAEAAPTYADNPYRTGVKDRYDSPMEQHREWPMGDRPPSNEPPGRWGKYNQDQIKRSKRDEHVLNGDEGPIRWINQYRASERPNPYERGANMGRDTGRIQRPPHEYSFLRNPDKNYLGNRWLSGEHYSAAQTVTDQQAVALKGMVPGRHRSSTFRLEPIAFGELTTSLSEKSGFAPKQATEVSANAPSYARSFRLS